LTAATVDSLLPEAQKLVSRRIADRDGEAFLQSFNVTTDEGKRGAARVRSCQGAAASAWLEALPGETTTIADTSFVQAGRHRLGLGVPSAVEVPLCSCAAGCAGSPDHAMLCRSVASKATLRHDTLALAVRRCIAKSGCPSSMEPPYRHLRASGQQSGTEGQRRGDILTVLPNGRVVIVDVVVTHPAAPSYYDAASQSNGSAAENAAKRKKREFQRFADGAQYDFVPFAVESFGRLGEDARRFLSDFGNTAAQRGCVSKSGFIKTAHRELSCTLQRGNGMMYARSTWETARASGCQFQPGCEVPLEDVGNV